MKILHCVESYFPSVGGMQEVVKQLSERMVKLGYDVTVATRKQVERDFQVKNGVKVMEFELSGNYTNGIQGPDKEKYETLLLSGNFDVITFFAAQQWATDIGLPLLDKIKAVKVSVPTGYSGFYWNDYKEYFEKMKTWIHGYDMNVYLSDDYRDINFARANGVKNTIIIPNGAAADEFEPATKISVRHELGLPEDNFLLLHVGSYTGWKGHKEAIRIFMKSKLRNATLLMIGNNFEYFDRQYLKTPSLYISTLIGKLFHKKKIVFKYFPRDFTVAAYKQADLFFFPSNIECSPIVLFECAASSLPFLSTDVGNAREIAKWTGGGEIMPTTKNDEGFVFADIEGSVKQLNELYDNKTKRSEMGKRSYAVWKEKYSWEKLTLAYIDLYKSLLNKTK
jgi:glycosyltransferase involved in cell wall biosynthesis